MSRFVFYSAIISLTIVHATMSSAFASDECTDLRLDQKGGSMEHASRVFQNELGACYSYPAAQAIDAYRFSHGDMNYAHRTSPIVIAMQELHKKATVNPKSYGDTSKDITGALEAFHWWPGLTCEGIEHVGKSGSCNHLTMLTLEENSMLDELIADLLDHYLDYRNYENGRLGIKTTYYRLRYENASALRKEKIAVIKKLLAEAKFKSDAVLNDENLHTVFQQSNPILFVTTILLKGCEKNTIDVKIPQCKGFISSEERLSKPGEQFVREQLNKTNAQPVILTFCDWILRFGKKYRWEGKETKCGVHTALIIGQRRHPKTKECEFLVRNSWGPGCAFYSDDWECESDTGNIWVNAATLMDNSMNNGLNYLAE